MCYLYKVQLVWTTRSKFRVKPRSPYVVVVVLAISLSYIQLSLRCASGLTWCFSILFVYVARPKPTVVSLHWLLHDGIGHQPGRIYTTITYIWWFSLVCCIRDLLDAPPKTSQRWKLFHCMFQFMFLVYKNDFNGHIRWCCFIITALKRN